MIKKRQWVTLVLTGIFVIVICNNLDAQQQYATESKKAIQLYQEAIQAFSQRNFTMVEQKLEAAIKKDPKFIDAYLLRAEMYRIHNKNNLQILDLETAISIDANYFPYAYYNLGMAYMAMGEYRKAISNYNNFLVQPNAKEVSKAKASQFITQCIFADSLMQHPVDFVPLSLGDSINTKTDEYWPSLSVDGNFMFYSVLLEDSTQRTITGHIAHQEDFYYSVKTNMVWSKGKPLGAPINTPGNEGALKASADGKVLVFTACNRTDGFGRCDIYFTFYNDWTWTNAVNAGNAINTEDSEKQPCLSADGQKLYFSSNREGGFGGMDIWVSEIDANGHWGQPVNLGQIINTPYDEESPFLHPDNQTFYFSSDGHLGLGMKDIFVSRYDDSTGWQNPVNIGYPINTFQDEIGLFIDQSGANAYFSSYVSDSALNIYEFTLPQQVRAKPVSYLKGWVSDINTNTPLPAEIELLDAETGKVEMKVNATISDGSFFVCLPVGTKYALNVHHNNYLFKSIHFNLTEHHSYISPYNLQIQLQPVTLNSTETLNNIFFATDSYQLLPESKAELQKIAQFIIENNLWIFEIGGHTDQTGSSTHNFELSEQRAKAVYEYLLSENVKPQNVAFKGYGESNPVLDAKLIEIKELSRRTELKIIGKLK